MSELLGSAQFWGGAFLLLCFQIGKYSELNQEDEGSGDGPASSRISAHDIF
jgi:hypothetical protein